MAISPRDVAVDPNGDIYVLAHAAGTSGQKLAPDGTILSVHDAETGRQVETIAVPSTGGLAVDRGGRLLAVSDRQVVRVVRDGNHWPVVSAGLSEPYGLAVGPSGGIYVTDLDRPFTIRVFEPGGKPAGRYGREGSLQGAVSTDKLYVPLGLAVDAQGNVIVAEQMISRVQKLSPRWKTMWAEYAIYAENICHDVRRPEIAYGCSGSNNSSVCEYALDLETGGWELTKFWYMPGAHPTLNIQGFTTHGSGSIHLNGHQFYYVAH